MNGILKDSCNDTDMVIMKRITGKAEPPESVKGTEPNKPEALCM